MHGGCVKAHVYIDKPTTFEAVETNSQSLCRMKVAYVTIPLENRPLCYPDAIMHHTLGDDAIHYLMQCNAIQTMRSEANKRFRRSIRNECENECNERMQHNHSQQNYYHTSCNA